MILRQARAGDVIDIQAISARFYSQAAALADIEGAVRDQGRRAKIRVLVTNPVSRAAIMRTVADSAPIEEIGT
jgi:hypothetical protein